jgi:hypothetical protein
LLAREDLRFLRRVVAGMSQQRSAFRWAGHRSAADLADRRLGIPVAELARNEAVGHDVSVVVAPMPASDHEVLSPLSPRFERQVGI